MLLKKLTLCIVLISCSLASTFSHATYIVAKVGKEIITDIDLNQRIRVVLAMHNLDFKNEQLQQEAYGEVLQSLIEEKLKISYAKRVKIFVDQKEIDAAVKNLSKSNKIFKGGLESFLQKNSISIESLRDQIKAELINYQIMDKYISRTFSISQSEVEARVSAVKNSTGKTIALEDARSAIYQEKLQTANSQFMLDLRKNIFVEVRS